VQGNGTSRIGALCFWENGKIYYHWILRSWLQLKMYIFEFWIQHTDKGYSLLARDTAYLWYNLTFRNWVLNWASYPVPIYWKVLICKQHKLPAIQKFGKLQIVWQTKHNGLKNNNYTIQNLIMFREKNIKSMNTHKHMHVFLL